jgi:hypothetical protein
MQTMTLAEFQDALKSQCVPKEHLAFRCPMCGTIQSGFDLIAAGAGDQFEDVERYLGFSCIGRWLDKQPPPGVPGRGCDWTLGGLLCCAKLMVLTPDGKRHPHFEPCTPDDARQHYAAAVAVPCSDPVPCPA